MLDFPLWKRLLIFGVAVIGAWLAIPNVFYAQVERYNDEVAATGTGSGWPGFMPSGLVNLGLDLRGGAHVLVEVKLDDVYSDRIAGYWPDIRNSLRDMRDTVGTVRRDPQSTYPLVVNIGNAGGAEAAVAAIEEVAQPILSLTGVAESEIEASAEGGILTVQFTEAGRTAIDERTMAQSLEIIRRRVDEAGTREPTIQRQGYDRILVQVPGIGSVEELLDLLGKTAKLTFHPVLADTRNGDDDPGVGNIIYPSLDEEGVFYILDRDAVITGENLTDAQPDFDQNGAPAVSFRLNPSGGRIFGEYTAANIGNPFAIVLDEEVISAPVIRSHIPGGSGIITGSFSVEESTQLAVLLRAGALPADISVLEQRTVGPELGEDSIRAGRIAAMVAFLAVVVVMIAAYGLFGVIACLALVVNIILIFALMSVFGATLTLPGIAGIVLTMGMAVDANVLIFERIREEARTAKGPARAIEQGFSRALSAIVDANITTLIAGIIMFVMGTGPIKGFAVTLMFGLVTSVFTAIFFTRMLIVMWFDRARPKVLEV